MGVSELVKYKERPVFEYLVVLFGSFLIALSLNWFLVPNQIAAGGVSGVVTEHGPIRCSSVVLAGGAWSRLFAGNLGIDFPQLKILGTVARVGPVAGVPDMPVGGDKFAFRKRVDGGYSIARRNKTLVEITPDDAYLWGRLATHHSQERLVSPMALSFRDALFPDVVDGAPVVPWLRGVLADGERAAFVMVAATTDVHTEPFLWRLLVDRLHQRRGIGRLAVAELVRQLSAEGQRTLLTSWHDGPGSPRPFYERLGFVPTGRDLDGETEGRLSW